MRTSHLTQIIGALLFIVLASSARVRGQPIEPASQPTPGLPDLVEEELVTPGWPVSCGPPQAPTVSICVANVGAAAAGAFSVSGRNVGVHYDFFRLDGLDVGERRCMEAASFPLDAEVLVMVDSSNEVQESNEDNNTRWDFISFAPIPTCTATPMPTPTTTPTPEPRPCVGDCDGEGAVTVDEIVRLVTIALNGEPSPNTCPGSEQWCNSGPLANGIGITCLIDAVNNALNGCPTPTPVLPDLVYEGLNVDAFPSGLGCITRFPIEMMCVGNIGGAAAGPFTVSGMMDGWHFDFVRLAGLGAGERTCVQVYFPVDAEAVVTVDSKNEVQESDEGNNSRWEISPVSVATCTPTAAAPAPTETPTPEPGPSLLQTSRSDLRASSKGIWIEP